MAACGREDARRRAKAPCARKLPLIAPGEGSQEISFEKNISQLGGGIFPPYLAVLVRVMFFSG